MYLFVLIGNGWEIRIDKNLRLIYWFYLNKKGDNNQLTICGVMIFKSFVELL